MNHPYCGSLSTAAKAILGRKTNGGNIVVKLPSFFYLLYNTLTNCSALVNLCKVSFFLRLWLPRRCVVDMDDIHVHENDAQSEADSKRRKIRKGTRSCWDCKRRKMKCLFEGSPTSTESVICIGCKKRGSKCVSQEFDIPDELPSPLKRPKGHRQTKWGDDHERVIRVEALLEQLVKKSGDDRTSATSEEGWKVPGNPTDSSSSNCLNSQKLSDVGILFSVWEEFDATAHSLTIAGTVGACHD